MKTAATSATATPRELHTKHAEIKHGANRPQRSPNNLDDDDNAFRDRPFSSLFSPHLLPRPRPAIITSPCLPVPPSVRARRPSAAVGEFPISSGRHRRAEIYRFLAELRSPGNNDDDEAINTTANRSRTTCVIRDVTTWWAWSWCGVRWSLLMYR